MNDGDWVESCTALVEHHDGRWELLHFQPHVVKEKRTEAQAETTSELQLA